MEKEERRSAKEERKPHHTHLSGNHMPLLLPPQKAPPPSSPPPPPCALLLPSPPPLKPPGLWVSVPGSSECLPTPAGRTWQEGTSFPDLILLGGGGPFREGRPGTHPHRVSLPLPLLRMCLPDILCPRFSPEGPERPARTEDAARGESRPSQGQGAEWSLSRGRGPSQDTECISCHLSPSGSPLSLSVSLSCCRCVSSLPDRSG